MDEQGQLISGRYRVERTLGRGGMGAVLRVLDTSTDQAVALKRLTEASSAKHVALFQREYHTLAGMAHPNVIAVKDYGADASGPYYTMELLEGSDLSRLGPLPWREVCAILRDVAGALSLLHARQLVHRDVNPRNLWRTPDGRIKLIDFGALAAFGQVDHIVGTPPCVPPESLYSQVLDQRSDLYALGTVAYWLLTGRHAYPARALAQLKTLWQEPVRKPAKWVENLDRADLEAPPPALDALVMALLGHDPMTRPASATEVIDRLNTIADLPPSESAHAAEAHLASAAFAGRDQELRALLRSLEGARKGRGGSVVISAEQGAGRSRLLAELALRAGLRGATVIRASGSAEHGPGAVGMACARRLLDVAPELARRTAAPHAPVLGHLSPALRRSLGLEVRDLERMPQTPGEARMRLQEAMSAWFEATAREVPLTLLIDDLHLVDEASLAWLAKLCQAAPELELLVVATTLAGAQEEAPAVQAIHRAARTLLLPAMREPELREMLRSMFGQVPHLERLSERLHQHSGGNPAHAMQLAEYLVRTGAVRFADGGWMLPQHFEEERWPQTHGEVLAARLERLDERSRQVARALSLAGGTVSLEHCLAMTGLESRAALFDALDQLSRAGVLEGVPGGYRFAHEVLRSILSGELSEAEGARVHGRLAEMMLAEEHPPALTRLQAAVHGMRGVDVAEAPTSRFGGLAVQASLEFVTKRQDELREAVPHAQAALELFERADAPKHERVVLLTTLAIAGYYADRRLADRYADPALELLQDVLGLNVARRLRPYLGRRLSLYVALAWAAFGFVRRRNNPRVPAFTEAMLLLLNTTACMAGVAGLSLDPPRAAAYARILEPLCALGRDHATTISYRLTTLMAKGPQDRLAQTHAEWELLLARLRAPEPVRGLPDDIRAFFAAGAQYGKGIIECYRDGPQALRTADALAGLGYKIYEMSADQLRTVYHAHQGNLQESETYRRKVEMHAIARGTAWQVEAWLPGPMMALFLRTRDAASMKRQVQHLERLARKLPSMKTYLTRSLGAYHLLSGRYRDALPLLEKGLEEPTRELIGWARGYGAMAAALNALGEHARAREVCDRALAVMDEGDMDFCGTNLGVAIERARAEAGLGRQVEAARSIDGLIERYQHLEGPITLGSLHEVRLELSRALRDSAAVAHHGQRMCEWYRRTDVPSLLRRAASEDEGDVDADAADSASYAARDTAESLLHRLVHGGGGDERQLSEWMLSQLGEVAGVAVAYLLTPRTDGSLEQVASLDGTVASPELQVWAGERAQAHVVTADATELITGDTSLVDDQDCCTLNETRYRFYALSVPASPVPRLVATMVTEDSRLVGQALSHTLLEAAARRLDDALSRQSESHTGRATRDSGGVSGEAAPS